MSTREISGGSCSRLVAVIKNSVLFTDSQGLNNIDVPLWFSAFEVVEQSSSSADHSHQASSAGVVPFVDFKVFRQEVNFFGKDGNLHFRGAGIVIGAFEFPDEFLFFFFGDERHGRLDFFIFPISVWRHFTMKGAIGKPGRAKAGTQAPLVRSALL